MLPNVRYTRETLNVAALPATSGMELDYRTEINSPSKRRRLTLEALVSAATVAIVPTLALRVSAAYTATVPFLAGVLLLCLIAAFAVRISRTARIFLLLLAAFVAVLGATDNRGGLGLFLLFPAALIALNLADSFSPSVLTALLFGPLVWFLSVSTNTSFFAVFLLFVGIATLFLADAVTRHSACWMNCNPYLPRRTRRLWSAVWRPIRRFEEFARLVNSLVHPRRCRRATQDTELAERTRYLLGYPIVAVCCLAALLVYLLCRDRLLAGTLAVATFLVLLTAYGIVNVLTYSTPARPWLAFQLLWQAVARWHTYNIHATAAPGVFQSPYGTAIRRRRLWSVAVGALTLVLLPASWYFPIGVALFGIDPWLRDAAQPQRILLSAFSYIPNPLPWTPEEQAMLNRLPLSQRDAASLHYLEQTGIRRDYQALLAQPEYSLVLHVRAVTTLRTTALLSAMQTLAACLSVPSLVLFAVFWAVSSRVLLHHHLTLEGHATRPGTYQLNPRPSHWMSYVSRLRSSRYQTRDELHRVVAERDHLLIGFNGTADYPVLLNPAILAEHGHITGDSGSGKSSRGIAPLVEQLIERGDCSVVILDLKDDRPIFEAARHAVTRANAARNGRPAIPFRWFTNQSGRSTFTFNPFLQRDIRALTPHQRAEVLLDSLGLDYGEGFGPAYFSAAHRVVLERVLESNPQFQSFRQINRFFADGRFALDARDLGIDRKTREEASHLYSVMKSIATVDALNILEDSQLPPQVLDRHIDMGDVVRSPQVLYFGLAAAVGQASVRQIAKLALRALLVAAVRRGQSDHQTYLFIDEFQQVVSRDLEIVLRQARSQGIAVILANQTRSDLKQGPIDITPTVEANTRFRQVFSASDVQHQDALIKASGEAMYELSSRSYSEGQSGLNTTSNVTDSVNEVIGPRLRRNDIIEVTDNPLQSLVQVTRSQGFTQFGGMIFPIYSPFHISPEAFRRRQKAPWPSCEDHPGTIVTPLPPSVFGDVEPARAPAAAASARDQQAILELEQSLDSYLGGLPDDAKDKPRES